MKKSENPSEKPSINLLKAIPALERYASKGGWICFIAGFIGALVLGIWIFPMVLYSSQAQPMNFNHVLHLEGDTSTEQCLTCHEFRDDGTFAGIPKLAKCMECHEDAESPMTDTENEAFFLANYVAKEKEIPWLSYSRQPDCVYFSHIAHVKMGEMECKVCHGPFAESEVLPKKQTNRITGYSRSIWGNNIYGFKTNTWDRMKMDDCAECHSEKGQEENNGCFVCHK